MSWSLSTSLQAEIRKALSGDGLLALITIEHAVLASTRRYVRNTENVVSGGDTYQARKFDIPLPADLEERVPEVTLLLDSAGEDLRLELRDVTYPFPQVTLELVTIGAPDTVERTLVFEMRQWEQEDAELRGFLTYEPFLDRPFPGPTFTPSTFEEMF